MKSLIAGLATLVLLGSFSIVNASPSGGAITQDELVRRSQELFDAVAAGNQEPWKRHFADDCIFADEKGRQMNKGEARRRHCSIAKGLCRHDQADQSSE